MTKIHRNALVARSAAHMYKIVDDVEAYPKHFEWCDSVKVLKSSASEKIATLSLRFAGLSTSFTTRNLLKPHERIELSLVEGPFSELRGIWTFKALSAKGCKISLDLDFDLAGGLVGSAIALGFQALADHMVDDFVRAGLANNVSRPDTIKIEVAYVGAEGQRLVALDLNAGATIADAIQASDLRQWLVGVTIDDAHVGIWSKIRPMHTLLRDGDRVEIYRPLQIDPKEIRRIRAAKTARKRKR